MRLGLLAGVGIVTAVGLLHSTPAGAAGGEVVRRAGERLAPSLIGPVVHETWDAGLARELVIMPPAPPGRNNAQGQWVVPSEEANYHPHSGRRYVTNQWGDTRMGIGFPTAVDVYGATFAGQASPAAWTTGLRVLGYREGQLVGQTDWFRQIGAQPRWLAINLRNVDRIVIEAEPVLDGGGWYGMDDLTFAVHRQALVPASEMTVLTFEELAPKAVLTNTSYGALVWETGTGDFGASPALRAVPPPQVPDRLPLFGPDGDGYAGPQNAGTPPLLRLSFDGPGINGSFPPDTDGAIGVGYYVSAVNTQMAVFDAMDGRRITAQSFAAFWGVSPGMGDPRILFDQVTRRWFMLATDFSAGRRIYLAVSWNEDPRSFWLKTYFVAGQNTWPDYPTLGVDERGVYISVYAVGSDKMDLYVLDKAPLVKPFPELGTITAFRELPWEGAIQPAHAYSASPGAYLVSRMGSSLLRIRRVDPPITNPSLVELAQVPVPPYQPAPDAPALDSNAPLDTINDARLMMAVYRNGSLWTSHTVGVDGRAACRWYEVDVASNPPVLKQSGTVSDPVRHYFYPAIMVNKRGDAVLGFSGSHAQEYAGAYLSGRLASDDPGQMSPPMLIQAGLGRYNLVDQYGRNRWGDYSYTTLDPTDDLTFWTIQEFADRTNGSGVWATKVAKVNYLKLADTDCDFAVNFNDINPFVAALSGREYYEQRYPDCWWLNADCDQDGSVNFNDIGPFVALLGQ